MKKLVVVVLMLLIGCSAAPGDVDFDTIAHGDDAPGISERLNTVITNPVGFEELWNDIYHGLKPVPDMPKIDFTEYMVIAVSPGRMLTGGYDVEIVRVQDKKKKLDVTILVSHSSGGGAEALTQPHHIIKIKKKNAPVIYKWVEQ